MLLSPSESSNGVVVKGRITANNISTNNLAELNAPLKNDLINSCEKYPETILKINVNAMRKKTGFAALKIAANEIFDA